MRIPDHYVQQTARTFIEQHGREAVARARERVVALQAKGDMMGADIWLRVIVAVGEMQKPGTHSR
jgi:hypothetical protein